jgi:molecular chaperone DnaJ
MTIDFDPSVDYYQALGVDPAATAQDIKRAYRKLAKANHPDSTGGDKAKERRFKEISTAYELLSDETKRRQYDEIREQVRSGRMRPGGARPRPGGGADGPQVFDLSDLFSQFFSGQGGRQGAVHIDLDDDVGGFPFGGQRQEQPRRRAAPSAARSGHVEPAPPTRVRAPDGSWLTVRGADIHSDVRLPFQDAILGTVRDVPTKDGSATVKIPPGTSSGQKLRLRGKGISTGTGEPGDHYVTVQIDLPKDLDDEGKRLLHALATHLKGQGAHAKKKA